MSKIINIGVGGVNKKAKPHIGVGGVVKKVKAVFAGISGVVKELWKALVQYYTEGVQNVSWTILAGAPCYFESNRVYMTGNADSDGSIYTTNTVDLTNIKTIYFDWESNNANMAAFTFRVDFPNFSNAVNYKNIIAFTRTVNSIDVSSLTGEYILRISLQAKSGKSTLGYVYKVWGE